MLVAKAVILAPGKVTVPLLRRDCRRVGPALLFAELAFNASFDEKFDSVRLALLRNSMLVNELESCLTLLSPVDSTLASVARLSYSSSISDIPMSESDSVSKMGYLISSALMRRADARRSALVLPF